MAMVKAITKVSDDRRPRGAEEFSMFESNGLPRPTPTVSGFGVDCALFDTCCVGDEIGVSGCCCDVAGEGFDGSGVTTVLSVSLG